MNRFKEKSIHAISGVYQEALLQKYALPCILINPQEKVLLINDEIERYIRISAKTPGQLLADLVNKNIYQKLQKGIREVIEGEEFVLIDGRAFEVTIPFYVYITLLTPKSTSESLILIEFEDVDEASGKNALNLLPVSELQQQCETLFRTTEHDVRNLANNFIMLLKLEESSYSTDNKIHDLKEMQDHLLSKFRKNINQIKALLNLPASER